MMTVSGFTAVALAAGAAIGGAVTNPLVLIDLLVAVNLLAAAVAAGPRLPGRRLRPSARPVGRSLSPRARRPNLTRRRTSALNERDGPAIRAPPAMSETRRRLTVVLAAGVTVVLWSSAFVGIRFAGRDFQAGPLALGRLLVGSVALGLLVLARREPLPPRRALRGVVLCGVLWFAIYNVALNAAERSLD